MSLNPREKALVELWKRSNFDYFVPDGFDTQKLALQQLTDNQHNYVFYGGAAGGGKSFTGWLWLILNSLAYPGTSWFFSREELNDARKYGSQTFNEVLEVFGIRKSLFKYNGQDNFFLCPETGSKIYLLGVKVNPRDKEQQGLGSTLFTGGFMEECGEHNSGDSFDTLKTRVGRWKNKDYDLTRKIYKTGNPSKNYTYKQFYKRDKSGDLPSNYSFIKALVTDNPKRQPGYVEGLNEITDKAKRQRLRYGDWEYDNSDNALITYDAILSIFNNNHVAKYAGGTYITADIALQGSDKFVVGVWYGFELREVVILEKTNAKEVEQIIRKLAYKHDVPEYRIAFDSDGVGDYLSGYLVLAKPFHNGSKPVESNVAANQYTHQKERYKNLKSQCYFRLAKAIQAGKIWVSASLSEAYKENLIEELEAVKNRSYGTDQDLEVLQKPEVKDLIGRSPDISDMMMMRMYFVLHNTLSDIRDIDFYTEGV